jgi:hypothetical protein
MAIHKVLSLCAGKEEPDTCDIHIESNVWDIAAGELELNFEEDPLEKHFADTEQRMGSPPTPTGRRQDGQEDRLCLDSGGTSAFDRPAEVPKGGTP